MTTVGKGRGWGRKTEDQSLRRPGPPPGPSDELIERIRRIDVNDLTLIREPASPIADIAALGSHTENIAKLYNEALEDRSFIPNFLVIFNHPSNKIYALLGLLQSDYEGREEFAKKSPSRFLNYTYLMGEMCLRGAVLTGRVREVLTSALINVCKMLLDSAEEEEIEVVFTQIWLIGKSLKEVKPEELSGLMNKMREVLMSRNVSTVSRAMLLYSIELSYHDYMDVLNNDLHNVYSSYLEKILAELVRKRNLASVSEVKFVEPGTITMHTRNQNKKPSPPCAPSLASAINKVEEKEPEKPLQTSYRGPRAIRGSGVNGSREDEKKNARKSSSHWTDEKKGWGHDDRFERDY